MTTIAQPDPEPQTCERCHRIIPKRSKTHKKYPVGDKLAIVCQPCWNILTKRLPKPPIMPKRSKK